MNLDERLLRMFYDAGSEPVHEMQLASRLGVTRGEVSARIAELRGLGYVFASHPHEGHRLVESPGNLMADDLLARMGEGGRRVGNRIVVLESTASTNDVVDRLAREGHPDGLVVFAEAQTAGRGRLGRVWVSPPRKGLWFTVLMRPELPLGALSRLTVMAGVAVADALRRATDLPLRIKWPNDVLCRGRKVAGILTELGADAGAVRHAAVGIGIDVNLEEADFPGELRGMATSLRMEAGRVFHRPALAVEILREMNRCSALISDVDFSMLMRRWAELDETVGRMVTVAWGDGRRLRGTASGLDGDGALLVRMDGGRVERVMAGDVTLEKEQS